MNSSPFAPISTSNSFRGTVGKTKAAHFLEDILEKDSSNAHCIFRHIGTVLTILKETEGLNGRIKHFISRGVKHELEEFLNDDKFKYHEKTLTRNVIQTRLKYYLGYKDKIS